MMYGQAVSTANFAGFNDIALRATVFCLQREIRRSNFLSLLFSFFSRSNFGKMLFGHKWISYQSYIEFIQTKTYQLKLSNKNLLSNENRPIS